MISILTSATDQVVIIRLPWEFELLAAIERDNGSATYIMTRREEEPRYVVHRFNQRNGLCCYGDYHVSYEKALHSLLRRVRGD